MTKQKKPFLFSFFSHFTQIIGALCLVSLCACSPKFDWREVNDADAPYVALFPAKPNYHTKELELDSIRVKMTMTGAEVESLSFAIAYAKIETAGNTTEQNQRAQERVLMAMQSGMIKNIQGRLITQPTNPIKNTIQAVGRSPSGKEIKLVARFVSHGSYVLQVVMLGDEKSFTPEHVDMFFGSFKLK